MFHPDTQFLIDHWVSLSRGAGVRAGVPDRSTLRPDELGLRLPRTFIAQQDESGAVLKLVGGWIEAFHDLELKDQPFESLWSAPTAGLASNALSQTIREGRPVVLAASAGESRTAIEIVLTPFRGPDGTVDRVLGLYAPSATLSFARDESRLLMARLALGVGRPGRPPLSLAAVHGQRVA